MPQGRVASMPLHDGSGGALVSAWKFITSTFEVGPQGFEPYFHSRAVCKKRMHAQVQSGKGMDEASISNCITS
ncbi:hypothetical protein PAAG_11721 [Paracoccidioides lutzii Pb01]|uniref:Uncharacterized protein n=1 Tax=Paracoccidioides lutzii (strain ATCC MYA-826 / Pb01) TaxID=502779 RepID=A0A0A2V276_PARBA|nr:hypothetical protein PAAG_11721 [Paracoccidioides lutzii Pb01]KGQ01593.1 hypothetical protein PAAG_11721 [Paracoccidioides lutzii Pb01]